MAQPLSRTTAVVISAICAACLISVPAAVAITLPTETCASPGGKTLVQDEQARVYSVPVAITTRALASEPSNVFGCTLPAGRSVLLGSTRAVHGFPVIDPRTIALSSPWVAYSLTVQGKDGNTVSVALRNLETDKVKRQSRAEPWPPGAEHSSKVTKIGVNKAGAFAWISTRASIGGGRAREVAGVDTNGEMVVFDTAADIDLLSLKLQGDRLMWTDGGVGHSAVLF
jgi:hypothetical protein